MDCSTCSYEEILDISLFFTLILTFSCCSLSMFNTGDEIIYLHYFDFVNFYKKSVGEILIVHAICFKIILIMIQHTVFRPIVSRILSCLSMAFNGGVKGQLLSSQPCAK